jgi:hypothetical protein
MTETTTTAATTETAQAFETEPCSRCGGSGHYSYCQMYGTTCFRCAGRKRTYTKRGRAAANYFESLCMVPVGSLQAGDVISGGCVTVGGAPYNRFEKITAVGVDSGSRWIDPATGEPGPAFYGIETIYKGAKLTRSYANAEQLVRKGQSKDDKAAKLAQAYAYQATLTKAGKPRKTKSAA